MIKKTILVENKSAITTKNQQLVLKSEVRENSIPFITIRLYALGKNLKSCFGGIFFWDTIHHFIPKALALMEAASFFESLFGEQKRYSEQQEIASKKTTF